MKLILILICLICVSCIPIKPPIVVEPNEPPIVEPNEPQEPNEPVIWTTFDVQWPILWGDCDVYMMQMKTVDGKIETNTYGK